MIHPYKINSVEELHRLSELASKEDFNVYISTELGQIDAKSILALFTIMGKEVNLVAPDHADSEKFIKFLDKLNGVT